MTIAADMASITTDAFMSASVVFGASTITAKKKTLQHTIIDEFGATRHSTETYLEMPIASLATIKVSDAITVDSVAFKVRDVRTAGGGHVKHVVYG